MLWDLVTRLTLVEATHGPDSTWPLPLAGAIPGLFGVLLASDEPGWHRGLHLLGIAAAVLMLLGWRARVAAAVT